MAVDIIEGIDIEVLLVLGVSLGLVAVSLFMAIPWSSADNGQVRPELENDAATVRDRVGQQQALEGVPQAARSSRRQDSECPVCYTTPPQYSVETSCGHTFCAGCILTWWEIHEEGLRALLCPCCRQRISMFFVNFSAAELETDQVHAQVRRLMDYNRLFSGAPRSLLQQLQDTPILLRRLFNDLINGRNLHVMFRVRNAVLLAVVVLYLLSPFDIIPEAVFGVLGVVDDVLFTLWVVVMLCSVYRAVAANADR